MDHCPHCPAAAEGRPCRAVVTKHRRFCELTDPGHPDYSEAYARLISGTPAPEPAVTAVTAGLAPEEAPTVAPPPPRPGFEPFTRELLDAIKACPDRVAPSCGCSLPHCKRGKGNRWGLVNLDDCRDCLRGTAAGEG